MLIGQKKNQVRFTHRVESSVYVRNEKEEKQTCFATRQENTAWEAETTEKEAKNNVGNVVEEVANKLGNTVAVSRKCYIHPSVFETYMEGRLQNVSGDREFVRLLKRWSKPASKTNLTLEQALAKSIKAGRKK